MQDLSNPLKIIDLLSDGQVYSSKELAAILGTTCAGINEHIELIRQWGIALTTEQGYQLIYSLDLLKYDKIAKYYQKYSAQPIGLDVIPIIGSTNQYLLNKINKLSSGSACVAEYQQAGRGRRGRQWFSPFGSNLYLSMYWRLAQGLAAVMGLSLVIGMVVANVLRKLSGQDIKVKWPNDLYLNDKKLAGILVEISAKTGDVAHVVIGVGINLNMHAPDQHVVNQAWSNLGKIDRNLLVAHLLFSLREALGCFEKKGFAAFFAEWAPIDNFINRSVKLIIDDTNIIKGICRGINPHGALLLEQDGKITPYIGGEISLRADE
ncbi:bifunctional biotin--[acetyl-CoA-carboxylase] ligase/biotin operon repressor BirA [Orbus sturtevantii]|uniref:bifunctional biotin--[acetyl-CoA-carboxylase] ligase/biotin operon repressor BirA n=1 Tax=Orbus sturtevantii TaxID=3074109 RepID=UPI00370D259A